MNKENSTVKLKQPTDFLILECLLNGRNVASNIHQEIDRKRSYVNARLPVLADYGLIHKIGPSERSGLYEITPRGKVAIKYKDQYGESEVDFDRLLDEKSQELDDDPEREAPA
jgi:predicted transcriptional regulator